MNAIPSPSRPFNQTDPKNMIPPSLIQRLIETSDDAGVRLYRVVFAEGARTHWHRHDKPQLLFGLSGRCIVVNREGQTHHIGAGDVVVIQPGEEHWHGAAPGGKGEHLAINVGEVTTWLGA